MHVYRSRNAKPLTVILKLSFFIGDNNDDSLLCALVKCIDLFFLHLWGKARNSDLALASL